MWGLPTLQVLNALAAQTSPRDSVELLCDPRKTREANRILNQVAFQNWLNDEDDLPFTKE